jgi:HEAT repeat protein
MTGSRPTHNGKPLRQKVLLPAVLTAGIIIGFAAAYLTFDHRSSGNEQKGSAINQAAPTAAIEPNSTGHDLSSSSRLALKSNHRQRKSGLTVRSRQSNSGKNQMIMRIPTSESITDPQAARDVAGEVMLALSDPDAAVRESALEKLEEVNDESINEPLQKALNDTNASVREAAMFIMNDFENPEMILPALTAGIDSGDPELAEASLDILSEVQTHQAIDLVIEKGLNSKNSEIREEALSKLEDMTGQEFDSPAEAQKWWLENKDTFVFEPVYGITFRTQGNFQQ